MRNSKRPLSAQLIVIWRMSSSKHCAYNSSRIGQFPVSRAFLCSSFLSSSSWRFTTSWRVVGTEDTYCTHNWPSSVHSLGGRILFNMSSVAEEAAPFVADEISLPVVLISVG